jgi:ubiquinone/menaquinone biosynthesis C-methylase UbiE
MAHAEALTRRDGWMNHLMQTLLQQAGVNVGQRVLDVGFRDTEELQAIASLVGPTGCVLGMDIVPQCVEAASEEEEMTRVCKPEGLICIIDFQRFSRFRFELYRLRSRLRGYPPTDIHPGFTREQLDRLMSRQQLEEVHYEELSIKWRIGSNEVSPFLLKVRRAG